MSFKLSFSSFSLYHWFLVCILVNFQYFKIDEELVVFIKILLNFKAKSSVIATIFIVIFMFNAGGL